MLWGAMGLTLPHCGPQEQALWVCRCEAQWGLWVWGLYGPVGSMGVAMGLTLPPCAPQEQASWVCRCEAIWGSVGAVGL